MVKQFLSTIWQSATRPTPLILWLISIFAPMFIGAASAAVYTSVYLNTAHFAASGTVIDGSNAPGNTLQNITLGSASPSFSAGLNGLNSPYVGCTGTSVSCILGFYTAGVGSSKQAQIDATGDYFANADATRKFGTFLSGTSVASVSCNNFFWHNGTNAEGCANQTGDLGLVGRAYSGVAYGANTAAALPYQWLCSTNNGSLGASSSLAVQSVTGTSLVVTCNGSSMFTIDGSGNVGILGTVNSGAIGSTGAITSTGGAISTSSGSIHGSAHNACGSSSGWPCEATLTITYSSQTGSSNTTTVPAGSVCTATIASTSGLNSAQGADITAGLSSTTLTIAQTYTAAQTGSEVMNITCL